MKHLPKLHTLQRKHSVGSAYVRPGTPLPSRDLFAKSGPAVLTAYDEYVALTEQVREHSHQAISLRDEARAAAIAYKAKVAEAMSKGRDPGKVPNKEPELAARAAAHDGWAAEAKRAQTAAGHPLGRAIATAAPELYPSLDDEADKAAEVLRAVVDDLRRSYAKWAEMYQLRRVLTTSHLYGGALAPVGTRTSLPSPIADALDALTHELEALDRLRNDVNEVNAWRSEQERAEQKNARMLT